MPGARPEGVGDRGRRRRAAPSPARRPKGFDVEGGVREARARPGREGRRQKKASLDALAKDGPEEFDAVPWARRAFGKAAPVTKAEITSSS